MKKISSILASLVLGLAPTLMISKVTLAECNFHGCSQVPGVECNFHGCPNPPNGGECNFHGCPPAVSVPKPVENPTPSANPTIIYANPNPNPSVTAPPTSQPRMPDRESLGDCLAKVRQIDADRSGNPDYTTREAWEMCSDR